MTRMLTATTTIQDIEANTPFKMATRSALAALTGVTGGTARFLGEAGREGIFLWETANHSAHVTADTSQGVYVAPTSDTTGASGAWVRKFSGAVNVKWFGATGDGTTNDSAAFVATISFLKSYALNTSGGGFYKGSPKLFIPAGHYYLGTTTLDVNHTLTIEGEGSGQFGPGAGGCTHLRWADTTDGIRFQAANTSGNTTVDGSVHDGSGGGAISDMCLEGGYASTESEHHGLVIRNAIKAERLYIKNFPGEAVKAWAGTVTGTGAVAGNVSTTMLISVKAEGNRGGFDIRGTDANVVTTINCEAYQNRWFGLLDDNGAGSNTHVGMHCASNGLITGTWPQTQCSLSTKRYAAVWGGDPTISPSGTTADTANWFYIEAGAAITNLIPAWVSTANTFRAGGDYLVINSASVLLSNCYSEYGSFNQFNTTSRIDEGTIGDQYFRGGTRVNSGASYGFHIRQNPNVALTLQHRSTNASLIVMDEANVQHSSITFGKTGGNDYVARDSSGHGFWTAPYNGAWTKRATIDTNGVTVVSGALGYGTGVGGAVTQTSSRTTAFPTINKICGQLTLVSAAGSAAWQTATVPNTSVTATDVIRVNQASGTDKYMIHVTKVVAGTSFDITFATTGGTTTESPVFNFAVIRAVSA